MSKQPRYAMRWHAVHDQQSVFDTEDMRFLSNGEVLGILNRLDRGRKQRAEFLETVLDDGIHDA